MATYKDTNAPKQKRRPSLQKQAAKKVLKAAVKRGTGRTLPVVPILVARETERQLKKARRKAYGRATGVKTST